jgi:glycine dehydrogenase subunit 1
VFAGLDLALFYPELNDHYLFCATEKVSKQQMDQLAKEVA